MSESSTDNGKTVAIISYITLIGWIIAFIMNNNNKSDFGSYHLRQSLGIISLSILLTIVNSIIDISLLAWIIQIGIIVFWALGFVSAIQGEKKPVPLLGIQFQEWFKGIG
jgi:uncharacterized membrane protein